MGRVIKALGLLGMLIGLVAVFLPFPFVVGFSFALLGIAIFFFGVSVETRERRQSSLHLQQARFEMQKIIMTHKKKR